MSHQHLTPDDRLLLGDWFMKDGKMFADEACQRIEWLLKNGLEHRATTDCGWTKLYEDPRDGRLWVHTYRMSYMHGGGPPSLELITEADAREKFPGEWIR